VVTCQHCDAHYVSRHRTHTFRLLVQRATTSATDSPNTIFRRLRDVSTRVSIHVERLTVVRRSRPMPGDSIVLRTGPMASRNHMRRMGTLPHAPCWNSLIRCCEVTRVRIVTEHSVRRLLAFRLSLCSYGLDTEERKVIGSSTLAAKFIITHCIRSAFNSRCSSPLLVLTFYDSYPGVKIASP